MTTTKAFPPIVGVKPLGEPVKTRAKQPGRSSSPVTDARVQAWREWQGEVVVSGACLARVGGLGTFEHEPESFGASDLSSVRSDVEVAGIEWSCVGAGGLAG